MKNNGRDVWFWQLIISPHMADLAVALAREGFSVTFVVEEAMSEERKKLGWKIPRLDGVNLRIARSKREICDLLATADCNSVHICQGIRSNRTVGLAQKELRARGLSQWVVMETVDDTGLLGYVKRLTYSFLFWYWRGTLAGVLANGRQTSNWVCARGMTRDSVFPFAYFLPSLPLTIVPRNATVFRFGYVGQLIKRKQVDVLIRALAKIETENNDFELCIVGSGPEEKSLQMLSDFSLGDRVKWVGKLESDQVPKFMREIDCLVLPSKHDGWGAVASEALIHGTPVICNDKCGVSEVVSASGVGGIYDVCDENALFNLLQRQLCSGVLTYSEREKIASWAKSIGSVSGAKYLASILDYFEGEGGVKPVPPWRTSGL